MAYEKLNLENGTKLDEVHLAHFEEGIAQAEKVGEGAVLYTEQTLTDEQKAQARTNIRCGSVGDVDSSCVASGKNAHCEGNLTSASGQFAHAEGYYTTAKTYCAHAEGQSTTASGSSAHAEGYYTTAWGQNSHAEGQETNADNRCAHAEGRGTIASGENQHTQGKWNLEDTEDKYAHIVGNGTSNSDRSNAHTLDWDGVPWYAGDRVMLGGTGMDDEEAVALMPIFVEQTLTEEQRTQARANIGAAAEGETSTAEGAVLYTEQTLTDEQKAQARANIGISESGNTDSAVLYTQQTLTEAQKAQVLKNLSLKSISGTTLMTGIVSATNVTYYTLTISYTDGTSDVITIHDGAVGEDGKAGERGRSIWLFDPTAPQDTNGYYTVSDSVTGAGYLQGEDLLLSSSGDIYTIKTLGAYGLSFVPELAFSISGGDANAATKTRSATLSASGWSESAPYTQSVEVDGLSDDLRAMAYPVWPDNLTEKLALSEETAKVRSCTHSGSTLTFECWEDKPALDIPVTVEVYV